MDANRKSQFATRLGVVGGGTMGSGIALAALLADIPVTLHEISPEILTRARDYIETQLTRKRKAISFKYLRLTQDLANLGDCPVIIEAIPEDLVLKQALFANLDRICPKQAILATNTSTLPVTAIAAATERPERVAGMHFFNPAPVLPLVEVIRGARTAPETVTILVRLAEKMGKTPVVAQDTPGFIVNRVARPFYGEALRLLGEGVATHEAIDRIVREGGGFRMGPFELMDLIGIDINFAATQSIYDQTFHEPRYRPHWIQAQMVAQKAYGRKTGRGFYEYTGSTNSAANDQRSTAAGLPSTSNNQHLEVQGLPTGSVFLTPGSWTPGMEKICHSAMMSASKDDFRKIEASVAIVSAGRNEGLEQQVRDLDNALLPEIPILCQCADTTLAEIAAWMVNPERLIGFDGLFFASGQVATLVASPDLAPTARTTAEDFVSALGRTPLWIEDTPGLILPRIVCTLANEAAFAVGDGVADPETIDRAMQLGTNYPKGPLAWAAELGYAQVVVVLEHLHAEYGEERYRVAPLLRKWARQENVKRTYHTRK